MKIYRTYIYRSRQVKANALLAICTFLTSADASSVALSSAATIIQSLWSTKRASYTELQFRIPADAVAHIASLS